jgi:hypothetical protein
MTDTNMMKIAGPPNAEKRRTLYLENKYLGPNAIKKRPVYPYLKDIIACGERRLVNDAEKRSAGRYDSWFGDYEIHFYYSVASIGEVLDYQPVKPYGCRGTGYYHCKERYTWVSRETLGYDNQSKYSILGVSNHLGLFHYGIAGARKGPCYTTDKPMKKDLQKIIDTNSQFSLHTKQYKSKTTKADLWKIIMMYD